MLRMLVTPMWNQSAVGVALELGLSVSLILLVAPLGWMDRPDEARKHHAHPVARTGGLALWLGLILAQAWGQVPFPLHPPDWVAIHGMALIGLLDDRFNLRARYKAGVGLSVALLLAFHTTQTLGWATTHVPFLGMDLPTHPVILFPILMLWFWGIPQAYNLIDGINGLSMGFAALLLGVLGWNLGSEPALFWGGLAAVLALNFPKAHHFLGDCGALMLGTLFAILGVQAFALSHPDLLLWVFAYPIVDVSLVVGLRRWHGHPLTTADRNHLHHWMMDRVGRRAWIATPLLLSLAGLPMLRATALPWHQPASTLGLLALVLLALKAFKDRAMTPLKAERRKVQVRHEVPFLVPETLEEAHSGSHPRL
jgi:UDP-GlcNAc:undecaprenyl-phosphate/decaprenyl-phosphate GlcNAc-1-phosphate transferase